MSLSIFTICLNFCVGGHSQWSNWQKRCNRWFFKRGFMCGQGTKSTVYKWYTIRNPDNINVQFLHCSKFQWQRGYFKRFELTFSINCNPLCSEMPRTSTGSNRQQNEVLVTWRDTICYWFLQVFDLGRSYIRK